MKKIIILIFLFFVIGEANAATTISECCTLNDSNTEYVLNQSISSNLYCIVTQKNNISIDCAGFSINSTESIALLSNYSNYTQVKNCVIDGTGFGVALSVYSSFFSTFINSTLYGIVEAQAGGNNNFSNLTIFSIDEALSITDDEFGDFFLENTLIGSWIDEDADTNFFNSSKIGNRYIYSDMTEAWEVCNISSNDGDTWSDEGSDLPFSILTPCMFFACTGTALNDDCEVLSEENCSNYFENSSMKYSCVWDGDGCIEGDRCNYNPYWYLFGEDWHPYTEHQIESIVNISASYASWNTSSTSNWSVCLNDSSRCSAGFKNCKVLSRNTSTCCFELSCITNSTASTYPAPVGVEWPVFAVGAGGAGAAYFAYRRFRKKKE
jgi:hypothetical protein